MWLHTAKWLFSIPEKFGFVIRTFQFFSSCEESFKDRGLKSSTLAQNLEHASNKKKIMKNGQLEQTKKWVTMIW